MRRVVMSTSATIPGPWSSLPAAATAATTLPTDTEGLLSVTPLVPQGPFLQWRLPAPAWGSAWVLYADGDECSSSWFVARVPDSVVEGARRPPEAAASGAGSVETDRVENHCGMVTLPTAPTCAWEAWRLKTIVPVTYLHEGRGCLHLTCTPDHQVRVTAHTASERQPLMFKLLPVPLPAPTDPVVDSTPALAPAPAPVPVDSMTALLAERAQHTTSTVDNATATGPPRVPAAGQRAARRRMQW